MTKALPAAAAVAFERFFAAYPSRPENPKAAARAVFGKLVAAGEDADQLVTAASRYADFCRRERKDPAFIPHARTWLNQRRFEDYLEAPASAAGAQPSPEPPAHALAFLLDDMDLATWRSWIEPLEVRTAEGVTIITARTQLALDKVHREWGRTIRRQFGEVAWALKRKD